MKRITNVGFCAAVLIVHLFLWMAGPGWARPEPNAGRNAIAPGQKGGPRVSMETEAAFSSISEIKGADVYTTIKGKEPAYASNELIIKFRDEFSITQALCCQVGPKISTPLVRKRLFKEHRPWEI